MTTKYNPKSGGGSGNATSLQNVPISATPPTNGQGLVFDGTHWTPEATSGNATEIQGNPVSAAVPTTGQGLVFIGGQWVPANVVNSITATGAGISTGGTAAVVTVQNTGVTSAVAGTGIGVSGPTGAVTVTNTGVTSVVPGTGINVSGPTGAVNVVNAGVTTLAAGGGISVTGATPPVGALLVSNTGVLSVAAGSGAPVAPGSGIVASTTAGVTTISHVNNTLTSDFAADAGPFNTGGAAVNVPGVSLVLTAGVWIIFCYANMSSGIGGNVNVEIGLSSSISSYLPFPGSSAMGTIVAGNFLQLVAMGIYNANASTPVYMFIFPSASSAAIMVHRVGLANFASGLVAVQIG
jgi:hypothetical protein